MTNADNTISITGFDCTTNSVVIPDWINSRAVAGIGYGALQQCTSLRNVTMGTNLTSITIPNGVTAIWLEAFRDCTSLTSITIPNSVTQLGVSAFYRCTSLTNVTISASVTSIASQLFEYCGELTSITIPASVTTLGDYAFGNCTNVTSVYFKGNAPTNCSDLVVFSGATNVTLYCLPGTSG